MKKENELEIINKCLNGDELAYSEIISAYQKPLVNFIMSLSSSKEDAEDISQECFHRAFIALAQYDPKYAFSTWLYSIARNACIDHYRKNINYSNIISMEEKDFMDEGELCSSPEDEMIHNQSYESLIKIIECMESHYREVAELRFVKDFPYEEIAIKLNIPVNTVKTRLHRSRNILMSKIKK